MMTRKDYIQTANILREFLQDDPELLKEDTELLASKFIAMFVKDNDRFNRDIFLDAIFSE